MKSIRLLLFISLLFAIPVSAQKEAAIWYFGYGAGLDFNSGSPVALTNGKLFTNEGCASISDRYGNLLFYTDGSIVYDKSHQIMPNGTGLLGHRSSTQSAIIVPKPKDPNLYYIFTVDEPNPVNVDANPTNDESPPNSGLNYSVVDLRLNNGLGDIVSSEKNIPLITYDVNNAEDVKFKCSEKITAVQHSDGLSFWVVTHFRNTFYSFKVSTNGVDQTPIKTITAQDIPLGGYNSNAIGYLKASPNGKKIAIANMATKTSNNLNANGLVKRNTGNVYLYNFDADSGIVSSETLLYDKIDPYGIEFSAKSAKLYMTYNKYDAAGTSQGSSLIQYDLKKADIANSMQIINSSNYVAGALQLAIDEKIYRSGYSLIDNSIQKISVINNPEADGINCNFIQNKIDLKTGTSQLGLPPFITSLFLYTFDHEFNCLGQSTHFYINSTETIDTVLWNFGDGSTSTNKDAYHTYATAGDYKVTLIKTVNGENRESLEKTITIFDKPTVITTPYKLIQCDTQDSNSLDGLATFNLSSANEVITLGNNTYEVFYYHTKNEAEADSNNTSSLNPIYKNTVPKEVLYAKISQPNLSCYSIATIILQANPSNSILPEDLHKCDLGDGKAEFDLEEKKQLIKAELNLPADVKLFFYNSQNDASLSLNEIKNTVTTNSKTVFIRAENSEGCYGNGKFELIVEPVPVLIDAQQKIICESGSNTTVVLEPNLPLSQISDYTYLWSNGDTTPSTTVNKEGNYTLTIENKSGCTATSNYPVKLSRSPVLNQIEINDLNTLNEVIVDVQNPEDYQYMIHFQNGEYSEIQNSGVFENIPGGFHELIIESINGCGRIATSFAVLNAPKYFTPNNDGYNDYWNFIGINDPIYKNAVIYIYDRYGKLLKQLSPFGEGWDGTYTKEPMPASDYWFTIKLEDGREAKGHFSLKR
ncbi:T9SS type B sorting domain-containing protein [Flavobacterium sp. JAS]|uniref:T9SS type B sorting domain-containing protein n=1 Tax=Flavobacterium sp. JAS TaxID=2897329 RepID=UPI001E474718|nr:T9SS type B sorting domain-containing protein [Flavobacterium sp. JAS]MCD0471332.1 T9SS type B sorting domain-containing protein [Flavobacterium sp. JAS]